MPITGKSWVKQKILMKWLKSLLVWYQNHWMSVHLSRLSKLERNQNKHGISEKTRKLIKERDESRKAIHKSNVSNKVSTQGGRAV